MKIYFINNHINTTKIIPYLVNEKNINYIYSEEGIYIYDNFKLYDTIINDTKSKYTFFKNLQICINNSEIIKGNEIMQIPCNNLEIKNNIKYYKLRKNALVKLVIEYDNNKLDKWYFDIPDIDNIMIQEDINTFLSLIY